MNINKKPEENSHKKHTHKHRIDQQTNKEHKTQKTQ